MTPLRWAVRRRWQFAQTCDLGVGLGVPTPATFPFVVWDSTVHHRTYVRGVVGRNWRKLAHTGAWRSLVARSAGGRKVASSNLAAPTNGNRPDRGDSRLHERGADLHAGVHFAE